MFILTCHGYWSGHPFPSASLKQGAKRSNVRIVDFLQSSAMPGLPWPVQLGQSCRCALPAASPGRFGKNVPARLLRTMVSFFFLLFSCHAAAVAKCGRLSSCGLSFLSLQLSHRGCREAW